MNKNLKENTVGVVLAGGKSSRLGQDKAFLSVNNQPLWQRAANLLLPLVQQVVISHNSPHLFTCPYQVIPDIISNKGPLGGVYSVMKSIPSQFYLLLPVDLPLIKTAILSRIQRMPTEYDVVVPFISGKLEPLLARYKATCLQHIETCLNQDDLKVTSFFGNIKVKPLSEEYFSKDDPKLISFTNLNTPSDLVKVNKLIS